jgi:hypothetical protein
MIFKYFIRCRLSAYINFGGEKMSEETKKWYYSYEGTAKGPCTIEEIKMAIQANIIKKDTMVWPGDGEWMKASKSSLSSFFPEELFSPPPIPVQEKNILNDIINDIKSPENRVGWAYSVVMMLFFILDWATVSLGNKGLGILIWGGLFLYFGTLFVDLKKMKKAGKPLPFVKQLSFLITPLYLWIRLKHLEMKKYSFFSYVAILALWFIFSMAHFSPARTEAEFANQACDIAIDNNFDCVKVVIKDTVKEGENYKAKIYFRNGQSTDITIAYDENTEKITVWGLY